MERHKVTVFRQYPFQAGQKIYIEDGPRKGDWEVLAADEKNLSLRCPVTGREVQWKRFCYLAEERDNEPWPHED
jgi:hypothetical protein